MIRQSILLLRPGRVGTVAARGARHRGSPHRAVERVPHGVADAADGGIALRVLSLELAAYLIM